MGQASPTGPWFGVGDNIGPAVRCPGGRGVDHDDTLMTTRCPGCGTKFVSVVDEPNFPPHIIQGGVVTFEPPAPTQGG